MNLLPQSAAVLLPLLYVLAAGAYGVLFFAPERGAGRWARPLFLGAVGTHLAYLLWLSWRWRQFPAANVSQALSATAFAIAVVYVVVEWRGRERSTGVWVVALAGIFMVLSAVLQSDEPPYREIFHSPLFSAHAALGMLAYAAFAVAAAYGFLFLRLYAEIKSKRFSTFFGKLPPLEVLERMMVGALVTGFVSLTGTLVSGAVWAEQLFTEPWWSDPKTVVTILTWAFYGITLLLHRLGRFHGRQTALAGLAGFASVIFSLVAVNLFFTDIHEFV